MDQKLDSKYKAKNISFPLSYIPHAKETFIFYGKKQKITLTPESTWEDR